MAMVKFGDFAMVSRHKLLRSCGTALLGVLAPATVFFNSIHAAQVAEHPSAISAVNRQAASGAAVASVAEARLQPAVWYYPATQKSVSTPLGLPVAYSYYPPQSYPPHRFNPYLYDPSIRNLYSLNRPLSDMDIRRNIDNRLFDDTLLDATNIRVNVRNGVAVMTGSVNYWESFYRAERDAYMAGARRVINQLRVIYR